VCGANRGEKGEAMMAKRNLRAVCPHGGRRLAKQMILGVVMALCQVAHGQQPPPAPRLSLDERIGVALRNQPAIQVQNSGVNVAREQRAVARSYYFPQLGFGMAYTGLSQTLEARTTNPISGPAANVFSDAAAYFGIARQTNTFHGAQKMVG
jgi:hypothetical protein